MLNKVGGNSMIAFNNQGSFTLTAQYGAIYHALQETVGGVYQSAYHISLVSGDHQSQQVMYGTGQDGSARYGPLQAKVTKLDGTPAPGITVGFSVVHPLNNGMVVKLNASNLEWDMVQTNAQGIATLTSPAGISAEARNATGAFQIMASILGGQQVLYHLTVAR